MAKVKQSDSKKISLNKKRKGTAKSSFGPKAQKPKKYRGQGR